MSSYNPKIKNRSNKLVFSKTTKIIGRRLTVSKISSSFVTASFLSSSNVEYNLPQTGSHKSTRQVSGNASVEQTDYFILADASDSPVVLTLPNLNSSQQIIIKKSDPSILNAVFISGSNENILIEGSSSYILTGTVQHVSLVCDGSGSWFII